MSELNWYWAYVPYLDEPNKQQDSAVRAGYNKAKEVTHWMPLPKTLEDK